MDNELNWKVAGFAGEGIMTTGLLMSKTCARHGLSIFDYTEYPSLIRGGHNTYQIFAASEHAYAQRKSVDVLVALNRNALAFHKDELSEHSLILYDREDDKVNIEDYGLPGKVFNLPMVRLARQIGAERVMTNNVALGASVFFLGLSLQVLLKLIEETFGRKSSDVVRLNQESARVGYDFAQSHGQPVVKRSKQASKTLCTLTGNEAIGLGAVAGGLQFYAAYPMTPSSSLLHFLAAKAKDLGIVVKHAEDEISAINMALGASFAGVRSMVGTAGGGFCYMTEGVGNSGVAEIPLVIMEGMRPGPALGMPTWTAQADLGFILNASQDEFPRFVLTPGDAEEAMTLASLALSLAEKYQTLVMLVSDKYLSESRHTLPVPQPTAYNERLSINRHPKTDATGFYPRYHDSESGVSLRTIPGTPGGTHITNSYEHDEYGLATEEARLRVMQMNKRMRKFEGMKNEVPDQWYERMEGAKLTTISFGSTKGVIRAARIKLAASGIPSNMFHFSWVWPFPGEQVKQVLEESERTLIIEGNFQGQLARLIKQETGMEASHHLRRYDGRPFWVEDVVEYVQTNFG